MTTTTETPAEALARIQSRVSQNDFVAVMQFAGCGINPDEITPRENVLTFKAWKACGRRVAKGATGQKVTVWVPVEKAGEKDGVRPINAVLFHITQTIAEDAEKGTRPAAWNNPRLVKEGTYEDAGEPLVTPTPESEAFEAAFEADDYAAELAEIVTPVEIVTVNTPEELEEVFRKAEQAPEELDFKPMPAVAPALAPKTARQLSMF